MIFTTSHVFSPPTWATRFLKGHIKKIQCPSRYVTMYIKYSFYICNRHLFAWGSASAGAFTWFYCWRCVKATQRHIVNKVNAFYANEKANLCFKELLYTTTDNDLWNDFKNFDYCVWVGSVFSSTKEYYHIYTQVF